MFKGISKRWMLNTLSVTLTIIILIVVSLIFVVTYLFQSSVEQSLNNTSSELSLVFSGYRSDTSSAFNTSARDYVENFEDKEKMEVMVINSSGRIIMTTTGFVPSEKSSIPDFEEAKTNDEGVAFWNGKLDSGENAMSQTRIIKNADDTVVGAIRYMVSMDPVNSRIMIISAIIIAIGIIIMVLVIISGVMFLSSIIKPIRNLSVIADRIAHGDFSASKKLSTNMMTK